MPKLKSVLIQDNSTEIHTILTALITIFIVNCSSFNKIYSLVSEVRKFENYQFNSQVASTGIRLPFLLAAFDRVINVHILPTIKLLY